MGMLKDGWVEMAWVLCSLGDYSLRARNGRRATRFGTFFFLSVVYVSQFIYPCFYY